MGLLRSRFAVARLHSIGVLTLAVIPLAVGGCAIERTRVGRIEVWNRTLGTITVAARGGGSFDVGPCSHAAQDRFVLNRYEILDGRGGFIALHGGSETAGYELVTKDGAESATAAPRPESLPPCEGVIVGQDPSAS